MPVSRRRWRAALAALGAAGLAGGALLVLALERDDSTKPRHVGARPQFDVLYRPPTFVSRGAPTKLRYEIVCPLTGPPKPGFCRPGGVLHVRRTGAAGFAAIPLTTVRQGLATVTVPAAYAAGSGFEYYAELHVERGGSATVPRGGAAAPQRSWAIDHWTTVDLGRHEFGRSRPGRAVVEAGWGRGPRKVGLQRGVGPSAFSVVPHVAIVVLDQLNRRLAVYPFGDPSRPHYVRIRFLGGEGDLAIASDGTAYVLDGGNPRTHVPFVRAYSRVLRPLAETRVAEAPSNRLAIGPTGAIVLAPSEQWLLVGEGRRLLSPDEQERRALPARPFLDGRELVVMASRAEARLALFGPGGAVRSWRITSATPLGEVQLAEPDGRGLLVVLRVHTARRAEWQVLQLTGRGLAGSFSVQPVEWADAGPGARFRVSGRYLYELRSGRSGIEVARYRLPA